MKKIIRPTIDCVFKAILGSALFSPETSVKKVEKNKYLHLNFRPYDKNVNIYLSNHLDIHILQLHFFKTDQLIKDERKKKS